MRTYVVTEGASDVQLLKSVLNAKGVKDVEYIEGGGKSSIASMAQSLLIKRHKPVAVVMDADMLDKSRVNQQEKIYFDLLRSFASGVAFKVLLLVPEIEAVFFDDLELLQRELRLDKSTIVSSEAEDRPRETLERLLRKRGIAKRSDFINSLSPDSLHRLGQSPLFIELASFICNPQTSGTWSNDPRRHLTQPST
jgi:hypothetical protein